MISEPKLAQQKQPFRFPALVTLAPKRRSKVAAGEEETLGTLKLNEESSSIDSGPHRRKLRRSGRVVFGRPKSGLASGPTSPYTA
jgi:hypothetical protein